MLAMDSVGSVRRMKEPLLALNGVCKDYQAGTRTVAALRGVTLEIEPATFLVVAGPSGSGKSTLLHLMGCLDHPTSGAVKLWGQDVAHLPDRELSALRARRIGFVFQSHNLMSVLTAYENVEYPLRINKVATAEVRRRVPAMLEAMDLREQAWQRPGELSGGQCQRVAIARALVGEPDLVIADEPTANLDSATGASIVRLMAEMATRFGITFVIATHDPMVVAQAGRRCQLKDGQLVEP